MKYAMSTVQEFVKHLSRIETRLWEPSGSTRLVLGLQVLGCHEVLWIHCLLGLRTFSNSSELVSGVQRVEVGSRSAASGAFVGLELQWRG